MPGMNTGLSTNNPAIVSAFETALLHQGLFVLLIVALVAAAWNILRSAHLRQATKAERASSMFPSSPSRPEPVARRLLRVSFGLIWVFDGILQGQSSMPLGMIPRRLADEGLAPEVQESTTCCYAVQDKASVNDPDGARWEVYTVLADTPAGTGLAGDGSCCAGAEASELVSIGTKTSSACC